MGLNSLNLGLAVAFTSALPRRSPRGSVHICKGNIFSGGTASLQKEKAPVKPGRTSLQNKSSHTSNRLVKNKISSAAITSSQPGPSPAASAFLRFKCSATLQGGILLKI